MYSYFIIKLRILKHLVVKHLIKMGWSKARIERRKKQQELDHKYNMSGLDSSLSNDNTKKEFKKENQDSFDKIKGVIKNEMEKRNGPKPSQKKANDKVDSAHIEGIKKEIELYKQMEYDGIHLNKYKRKVLGRELDAAGIVNPFGKNNESTEARLRRAQEA